MILIFIWKSKKAKRTLGRKNKNWRTYTDYETYYKAIVINLVQEWHKNRDRNQLSFRESSEVDSHMWAGDF